MSGLTIPKTLARIRSFTKSVSSSVIYYHFNWILILVRERCFFNGLDGLLRKYSMNKRNISSQTRKYIYAEDSTIACSIKKIHNFKIRKPRKMISPCSTTNPIFNQSSPKMTFLVTSMSQKVTLGGIHLREAKISDHFFVVNGLKYTSIIFSS